MLFFNRASFFAPLGLDSFIASGWDGETDSKTASATEHRKEKKIEMAANSKSRKRLPSGLFSK
tara:strand:+ start:923 stop:1111 length:189 start_codon:yes stop_codon:yes gene_type:complete